MSFLFKSSKKGGPNGAFPPATRDIRSSEGSQSQIPTLNGAKPASPTPGQSANNSLNSLANEKIAIRSPPPEREDGRGSGPPSPENKMRNRSQDEVSGLRVLRVQAQAMGSMVLMTVIDRAKEERAARHQSETRHTLGRRGNSRSPCRIRIHFHDMAQQSTRHQAEMARST